MHDKTFWLNSSKQIITIEAKIPTAKLNAIFKFISDKKS